MENDINKIKKLAGLAEGVRQEHEIGKVKYSDIRAGDMFYKVVNGKKEYSRMVIGLDGGMATFNPSKKRAVIQKINPTSNLITKTVLSEEEMRVILDRL